MDDMMLKPEKREALRQMPDDRKWFFIQTQMKLNIQTDFSIISSIDLLKRVSIDHHSSGLETPFP